MKDSRISNIIPTIVVTVVFMLGLLIGNRVIKHEDTKVSIEHGAKVNKVLVDWVYGHSENVSRETCKQIVDECLKTDKPLFLLALIHTETNPKFSPNCSSRSGAVGLTQIMFVFHGKELIDGGILKDKRELFNIPTSIKAGNYVFTKMLKKNGGDVTKALSQYLGVHNAGYLHRIMLDVTDLYLLTQGV